MTAKTPEDAGAARGRRRTTVAIKDSMRELSIRLSQYSRQVGTRLKLTDGDLYALSLVNQYGPLGPTELARRMGVHPATMTGVLDRLQRGGWVERGRDVDATDRRAVVVRPLKGRNPELFKLLKGFQDTMDEICGRYSDSELAAIADFLHRTAEGAQNAVDQLADEQ